MNKKKGFTLIELIAVLVIMAIIALIVTPLVMSIIRKAKISARKRSIDAYGRAIELAIAEYLLDNGTFPTSIEDLTIEYSGPEVVCSTTQIKSNSSVYLAGCTVGGKSVDYVYGSTEYNNYKKGDIVEYNNEVYYVLEDSDSKNENLVLITPEPLSTYEVNQYGSGHINRYTSDSRNTAKNVNGYGAIAYLSTESCRENSTEGCLSDYDSSDVKYVVDEWARAKINSNDLIKAEIMSLDYMTSHFDYVYELKNTSYAYSLVSPLPSWLLLESDNDYWMMDSFDDTNKNARLFNNYGEFTSSYVYNIKGFIRPIVTIKKSSNIKKIDYYIGEKIEYNNNKYYVMSGADDSSKTITLLKAEPLSYEEVSSYVDGANNINGYGAISYYYHSTDICGWGGRYGTAIVSMNCVNSYNESKIKHVVDGWASNNFDSSVLKEARLLTSSEYMDLCVEEIRYDTAGQQYSVDVPLKWLFNNNYYYWTMSEYQDSDDYVFYVKANGELGQSHVGAGLNDVRPVIVLSKSALSN